MRTRILAFLSTAAVAAIALSGCTAPSPTPTPSTSESTAPAPDADATEEFTPIIGSVLTAPQAAPFTDGSVHLAYELHLSNVLSQDVELDSISVQAAGTQLLQLAGDDILSWIRVYGGTPGTRTLGPGQQALIWLDVVVDSMDDVPAELTHEIAISPATPIPGVVTSPMTENIAPTTPVSAEPLVIGPPVKGANWFDGNSCCVVTPHRGAVNPINGQLHVPERYAIDFVQLDDQDRVYDGPVDDISSYEYFGSDIIAVGDGPVVAMVSDLPEQKPGANPTGLTVAEYGGNHVVQKLGDGRYAFYAHLQPGNPVGLAVGQELKRGDLIGKLGNTGNTDSPHLHFHIMDTPLPLASNGIPFVFDSFELQGSVPSEQDLLACLAQSIPCTIEQAGEPARTNESPLFLDVMTFE